MITMRKSTLGFPFLSHMSMGLRLAVLRAPGAPLSPNKIKKASRYLACERRRIFSVTGSPENNVCEPELENDFCDVGIIRQSQLSSEKPRTTARGIRASQENKVQQQCQEIRSVSANYFTAARVAARSTRVSFYHAI